MTRLIGAALIGLLLVPAPTRAQDVVVSYHTDAIGSVRATTDATGALIDRYDFLPFGEAWQPPTTPGNRQFAGKERDPETGLDYFGARYHMSTTGRFTTVDPVMNVDAALADPQRWNRYAYALNNPFKFVDPDGRDPRLVGALIGAVVYSGWNAYVNFQQGRTWYENIGIEASKGLLVGATLGLAAPALAGATAAGPLTSVPATTAATEATAGMSAAAKSSGDIGRIIGWGTGQSSADVAQTIRVASEMTPSRVTQLAQQGLPKAWVQEQLTLYQKALAAGGPKLQNNQLLPRIELMKKMLEHWKERQ